MTNAPYSSGLTDPDRGDQGGAYAADQDPSYAAPVEPGYSYPPVEPTYGDPVTTDPWTESSDLGTERSTKDVAKDEAANVAGTAKGEGKAVAGTAVEEARP